MEQLTTLISEDQVYTWLENLQLWMFIGAMVFLLFEICRYFVIGKLKANLFTDAFANFCTLGAATGIDLLAAAVYFFSYYYVYEYASLVQLPITIWSIVLCVLVADFAYYWEHRFTHRVGFAWASHSVHHSSPHFNLSVAYRFGPLEGLISILFHIPLAILGFNPFVIFIAQAIVLEYQTFLHTEVIGKLPKPVELVMNTPSHHRVHHGRNPQYIDKNYAGMFIIWDRLFGTFAEEQEKVEYGLTDQINSTNPLIVFFHGFARLISKMRNEKGLKNTFAALISPP